MKKYILVFVCLLFSLSAEQKFSALLSGEGTEVSLTDQVTLTLTLQYPQEYKPNTPDVRRLLWEQIAFTQPAFKPISQQSDPPMQTAKESWQQRFKLPA